MTGRHDQGFTLVEVMVALVIVALVSAPLFQMFVTTSYVNKDAQVMDRANVLAVQQAETFKADLESYKAEYGDGDFAYCFYRGDGTFISSSPDLTSIPTEAYYLVKSDLSGPIPAAADAEDEGGYYPDFAGTIDLSQYDSDIDVIIKNTYEIGAEPAGDSFNSLPVQDSSKIKNNQIPIRVDYGGDPLNINLTNESNLEAEFYIFNSDNDSDVNLITQEGTSSIAYIKPDTGSLKEYDLTLTVNKLNKGVWESLLTYSTKKYV